MHLADALKRLTVHSVYTFFVSMCVPWELNPRQIFFLFSAQTLEQSTKHCSGGRHTLSV